MILKGIGKNGKNSSKRRPNSRKFSLERLLDFDRYYQNMGRIASSGLLQLIRQLSDPRPGDLDAVDLKKYKGVRPPFDSWDVIASVCKKVATSLTLFLSSKQG
jgi:hypothetical protein